MGLEIPTNKTPGSVIRETEAQRPALMGLCIVLLTVIELVLVTLIFVAIANDANSAHDMDPEVAAQPLAGILHSEQQIISLWLAGAFFNLSFVILLYQRFFMDHVTITKRRFRKWEDEGVQFE